MPKGIIALMLSAGLAFAADQNTMSSDMKKLEESLSLIQKGILYGQKPTVQEGVKMLKEANKVVAQKEQLPSYLPANKRAQYKLAFKEGLKVNAYGDNLIKHLDANEYSKAFDAYGKILQSCTNCHILIRAWQ